MSVLGGGERIKERQRERDIERNRDRDRERVTKRERDRKRDRETWRDRKNRCERERVGKEVPCSFTILVSPSLPPAFLSVSHALLTPKKFGGEQGKLCQYLFVGDPPPPLFFIPFTL